MSTRLDRNLEPLGLHHDSLLASAALSGVDVAPVAGAFRYVGYGESSHGYGPVCLLDLVMTPYVAEPHVVWFPWVRGRQKIGHFKWIVGELRKTHHILFNIEKSQASFFDHFTKDRLLRKIGVIESLPIVEEIHMYQVLKGDPDE